MQQSARLQLSEDQDPEEVGIKLIGVVPSLSCKTVELRLLQRKDVQFLHIAQAT